MEDLLLDPEARLSVLREAASTLLQSDDSTDAAQRLSDLVVPRFADWCAVDRLLPSGVVERIAVAHTNPAKRALARRLEEEYPPDPDAELGVPQVLRTGKRELMANIPTGLLEGAARSPEHLELLQALGLRSYVVLPLTAGDQVVGALTLVQAESGRAFDEAHLPALEDIAALAALAMKNAMLAAERREASHEAERQARLLQQFVDNLPELAWSARVDGHIDRYNLRWFEYTGTTPAAMEGWGWESVHDPELLPEVKRRWQRALDTGTEFEMEFTLRGSDGVPRWFLTRARPARDESGAIVRWFGVNTDIDLLKRTSALAAVVQEQSEEAQEIIERLDEARQAAEERVHELEAALRDPSEAKS